LFKGGRTTGNGGAILTTYAQLNLESCVFADNHAYNGGAISSSSVRIWGSTFYGNSADNNGGAVSGSGSFTGNIFYGNTAGTIGPALSTTSSAYVFNLTDSADWTLNEGEKLINELPMSPVSFRPLGGGEALNILVPRPTEYPLVDFYGRPVPSTGGAAGAAQTPTVEGGFILDYAAVGSGSVAISGAVPDSDGLISGSVTLTAQEGSDDAAFVRWLVDGTVDDETSPVLTLTMDGHKTVRAIFAVVLTVSRTDDNPGAPDPGSLREALAGASNGDIVMLQGQTITLTAPLDPITANIIIEGNGATLTQTGFTPGDNTQLLRLASTAEVHISRLHFTGGRAADNGAAIRNMGGKLTLESCVFTNNTTTSNGYGAAVYIEEATAFVTISGCTFYGNTAGKEGGAIYRYQNSPLILTGNIFGGNTAGSYPVVRLYGGNNSFQSNGYNVSDKASGTGSAQSGWTHVGTDKYLTDVIFDGDFKPSSDTSLSILPSPLPDGFPATYFDGSPRGSNSTPGAMPSN
jgi:predicted outer membrane repeat protein